MYTHIYLECICEQKEGNPCCTTSLATFMHQENIFILSSVEKVTDPCTVCYPPHLNCSSLYHVYSWRKNTEDVPRINLPVKIITKNSLFDLRRISWYNSKHLNEPKPVHILPPNEKKKKKKIETALLENLV